MDLKQLKLELDKLKVNPIEYSLSGNLIPDSIVILKNYNSWEVFYFDERGEINNFKKFTSESDACSWVHDLFKDMKDIESRFGINT